MAGHRGLLGDGKGLRAFVMQRLANRDLLVVSDSVESWSAGASNLKFSNEKSNLKLNFAQSGSIGPLTCVNPFV